MKDVMAEIERCLPEGGDWCSLSRAQTLASIVLAMRPRMVVEIGIWQGGSAIPMLLAMKHVARVEHGVAGRFIAIDPWSSAASVAGMAADSEVNTKKNIEWWSKVDHERVYQVFRARLKKHEVDGICDIRRAPSDDVEPPASIQLLSIDGNHNEQAIRDVDRFAAKVDVGGFLALDDLDWSTGTVKRAHDRALELGFVDRYRLGTGVVMQRTR